ncbi:hypothetical protein SynBIOSE41_02913 [Synechococcus sp. BIOS-E4-1]|nr:hypothetical protein SynBIOSE41_02913 [Synechococcus sp. BIOS-E4-1]
MSGTPVFWQLASSLKGFSRRYEWFCQYYRHKSKGGSGFHWGSGILKRLIEKGRGRPSKKDRVSQGQLKSPLAFIIRLNQITKEWQQVSVRFRRANGIRGVDTKLLFNRLLSQLTMQLQSNN